jgi:hypothetical protein
MQGHVSPSGKAYWDKEFRKQPQFRPYPEKGIYLYFFSEHLRDHLMLPA